MLHIGAENRILFYTSLVTIPLSFAFFFTIAYMLFFPATIPEVLNSPYPVSPLEVKRGEEISYTIHYIKTVNMPVVGNRNIICADGNLVTLAPITTNAPLGENMAQGTITIPEKTSLGECYIDFNVSYDVNPLRTEHRNYRTETFTVIE